MNVVMLILQHEVVISTKVVKIRTRKIQNEKINQKSARDCFEEGNLSINARTTNKNVHMTDYMVQIYIKEN